jgi:16S rRNA (cytosine1402-N4)-methyltransferase
MENKFSHYSVLLNECIDGLNIRPNGLYVDCTAGGGGHSYEIAKRLTEGGHLIAIDQDADAIRAASERLSPFSNRVTFVQNNFSEIKSILAGQKIDGALIDLGVSSYQLDTPERGFSYLSDAPLDMRMNTEQSFSAYQVINNYSESELARILFDYGEERFARRIAQNIIRQREIAPIETTLQLANLVKQSIPKSNKDSGHPAKRTFQAVRIEVNNELGIIENTLKDLVSSLNEGGRIAVITFHSLEDRIVKQTFATMAKGCICPPQYPICVCNHKPQLSLVSRKPILPTEKELEENSRSHSAKLRIGEKIGSIN